MSLDDKDGGLVSHLAELRKRLIHSFIFLIIFFVGCTFFFSWNSYVGPTLSSIGFEALPTFLRIGIWLFAHKTMLNSFLKCEIATNFLFYK